MNLLARRRQRRCFHHEHVSGTTWVIGTWIYATFGRERIGRLYRCSKCGQTWKGSN